MNEAKVREKYLELQMAAEQVKQMQAHLQNVASKKEELAANIVNLEAVSKFGPSEMLVPAIEGVFMRVKSSNPGEVFVNVGAGVCVKKSVAQAKELLGEKLAEIAQFERDMAAEIEKGAAAMSRMEGELSEMIDPGKEQNV